MLLINTMPLQEIDIGDHYMLRLADIDQINLECKVLLFRYDSLLTQGPVLNETVSVGASIQLLPHVFLTITKLLAAKRTYAVLGFEAPRSIRIRGKWMIGKGKSGIQLTSLTDAELCVHGRAIATTDLERELIERLESNRR